MRTRIASRTIARATLVLAVLAASIACDDKNPTAPSPPPVGVRSLAIGGTLALHQPGDTGQLNVTATFTDGTTKDVTAEAAWSCYRCPQGMVSVAAGLVTAACYGSGEIRVIYNGMVQSIAVRVAPEGAFLLQGPVTDGGPNFWLTDARVEATSAVGTYRTTTGTSGWFLLPGVGAVTLRASRDGYDDVVTMLTVDNDQRVTLGLQRRPQAGSIIGMYTLTFTASPSCTLPPEARRRTYAAQIEEGRLVGFPEDLVVMLNGAEFDWDEAGFTGARDGTAVRFQITDEFEARLAVVEHIGTLYMGYRGTATGMVSDRAIIATFDGRVRLRAPGSVVSECAAADHRLEFMR